MDQEDDPTTTRRSIVHAWQRHYGMEPRDDSKLTEMYAEGRIDVPPDAVARELMATDVVYKQTLYGETIEEFLPNVAARLREEYSLSWTATWKIVRFYGPIALKLMSVVDCGVRIPDRI